MSSSDPRVVSGTDAYFEGLGFQSRYCSLHANFSSLSGEDGPISVTFFMKHSASGVRGATIPAGYHIATDGSKWSAAVEAQRYVYLPETNKNGTFGQWVTVNCEKGWEDWVAARSFLLNAAGMMKISAILSVAKRDIALMAEIESRVAEAEQRSSELQQQIDSLQEVLSGLKVTLTPGDSA